MRPDKARGGWVVNRCGEGTISSMFLYFCEECKTPAVALVMIFNLQTLTKQSIRLDLIAFSMVRARTRAGPPSAAWCREVVNININFTSPAWENITDLSPGNILSETIELPVLGVI